MPNDPACEALLAAILESGEEALLGLSLDGRVQTWSCGAERLYGYTREEIIGKQAAQLFPVYELPENAAASAEPLATAPFVEIARLTERVAKDGTLVSVVIKRSLIRDEHGDAIGVLERGRRIRSDRGNSTAETQLRLLVEQMPVVLWTTDRQLKVTSNWGSEAQNARTESKGVVGRSICEFLHCQKPDAMPLAQHYRALQGESSHFEYKRRSQVLEIRLEPLRDAAGQIIGCIGVGLDITERKKSEEQMKYRATHDELTGLANYREFQETLERELRRAERSRGRFTILLLDLDGLKRINDRHGHLAGNRALKTLARVMKEQCRATDLAARFGGDEFGVVLIESDQGMAEHVAERIQAGLREERWEPQLRVSIGIAAYPEDGRAIQELLETADRELYRRKKSPERRATAAR